MSGPVPERSDALAAPRKADRGEVTKGVAKPVRIPHKDEDWHPIAKRLYESLKTSGQSDYFQNSDWAFAYSLCDDLSYYKSKAHRSGEMLKAIYSAMERLLVTEADRRRMRIELNEPVEEEVSAGEVAIADYQAGLSIVK